MSLSLQSLPLDVLRKIASFLPTGTFLQLRGVNWYFHDVFVELVGGQPMGIYLQRDFDDSLISLMSKLSGVVGQITLDLKYFIKFLNSSTFVTEFDMLAEGKKKSIILTDSSDEYDCVRAFRTRNSTHGFQRFLQLNSIQCITFWDISHCDLICKVLLNCNSLKRICISDEDFESCHVCCSGIQSRARNHTFDCLSRHEETLEYLYVSIAFPLSSLHRMKKLRNIHIEMGFSGEILLQSLPTKIERLTIPRPTSLHESFNLMSSLHDDSLPHLKELRLTDDYVGDREVFGEFQVFRDFIRKIVRAAPNLKKVTLDLLLRDAIAKDTIDRDVVDNLKKLTQLAELKIGLNDYDEYRLDLNSSHIRNNEAWKIPPLKFPHGDEWTESEN